MIKLAEVLCRSVGFLYPHGNWICPTGEIVTSTSASHQHTDTLSAFLGCDPPNSQDVLSWKNQYVQKGYVRVLFENGYVLFQTSLIKLSDLWVSDEPIYRKLRYYFELLRGTKVHLIGNGIYIIGQAEDFVLRRIDMLQIIKKEDACPQKQSE